MADNKKDPARHLEVMAELDRLNDKVKKERRSIARKKELWNVEISAGNQLINPSAMRKIEDCVWQSLSDELLYSVIVQNAKDVAERCGILFELNVSIQHKEDSFYMRDQNLNNSMKLPLPFLAYGEEPPDFCPHCNSAVGEYRQFTEYNYSKDLYYGRGSECGARWISHDAEQADGEWITIYWTSYLPCGNPSMKAFLGEFMKRYNRDDMIEVLYSFPANGSGPKK